MSVIIIMTIVVQGSLEMKLIFTSDPDISIRIKYVHGFEIIKNMQNEWMTKNLA